MKVVVVKRAGSGTAVDVVVVGATCAGLVAARDLAEAGRRVRVIDVRSSLAPVGGLGLASAWTGPLGHRIALHHGEQAAIDYLRGLAGSTLEVQRFAAAHGVPMQVAPAWGIAVDGHLAFQLRHEARLLRLAGIRVDFRDDQPFAVDVRPMLTVADQASVTFAPYLAALAQAAEEAGVEVTRASVRRIAPGTLFTDSGPVHAVELLDTVGVVGATRAPAVRTLRDAVRPVVDTQQLVAADEDGPRPIDAIAAWTDTPVEFLFTSGGGTRIVGRPGGDPALLAEWVRENLGVPVLASGSVITEESRDGLPVVGSLPGVAHAWAARGFGVADVSGGTWGGHHVARAILVGARTPATPLRALGSLGAALRTRFGVLADPKQRVAGVLAARGLSRRISERR